MSNRQHKNPDGKKKVKMLYTSREGDARANRSVLREHCKIRKVSHETKEFTREPASGTLRALRGRNVLEIDPPRGRPMGAAALLPN